MGQKICQHCREEKDFNAFHLNKCKKDGRHSICKSCRSLHSQKPEIRENIKLKARQRYKNNPRPSQSYALFQRIGITLDEYDSLLEKQNGVCAICKFPCVSKKRLAVDHDHKTNKIRGLLCMNCNQGIGKFKDSILLLKSAIHYLDK